MIVCFFAWALLGLAAGALPGGVFRWYEGIKSDKQGEFLGGIALFMVGGVMGVLGVIFWAEWCLTNELY